MADVKWTASQSMAINAKNCDILVSASAGSGKTAVLVERIIRHVTDREEPVGILSMLVVTYTQAAAAQLKEKLSKALKKQIALDPRNKFLRRQLADLPRASISTIHSFCLDAIKNNFSKLGLSSAVRIADASENKLLMIDIMNQTLEQFYDNGEALGIADFASFCDNFTSLRDNNLGEFFLGIYDKLYTRIDGIESLYNNALELEKSSKTDPFDNIWGKEIKRITLDYTEGIRSEYEMMLDMIEGYDVLCKAYLKPLSDDYEIIKRIENACENSYAEVLSVLDNISYTTLGRVTDKNYADDCEIIKTKRKFFKDAIIKIKSMYVNDSKTAMYLGEYSAKLNHQLYVFMKHFHKSLMTEKNKRGIVSFNDCEALALKLLCKDGMPTDTANSYRKRFKEIYIDEYQDVNDLQDCIFRMVAADNTRFLVGDIKQSIYGFRGARPNLFGNYRDNFDYYDETKNGRGCKIFLSENFRSAQNIINFANAVSHGCFIDAKSNIGYYKGDDLICRKVTVEESDSEPVTVAVVKENETKNAEAIYVCNQIKKLIADGVHPGDITILLRSLSSSALNFTQELERIGIPYYCDVRRDFFDNPEITLALCWLNSIDNTRRDVFVCGILKSPVYNFTLDDLTLIRREFPSDSLYDSVVQYTRVHSFAKGLRFIDDVKELREYSRGKAAHEVIWKLLYEKGLMSIVTKDKSEAEALISRNNMLLLYDYARKFENGEFKGLYSFLGYIEKVITAGQSLSAAAAFAGSGDTVKIMTIHHSKGLEFPYCFVSAAHKLTSGKDQQGKLLFHSELGIAGKIAAPNGLALYDSYIMRALRGRIEEENIEEEFRVLYVALTRGVSRMWVTCSAQKPDKFIKESTYPMCSISRPYVTLKHSYIRWILGSLRYCNNNSYNLIAVDAEELDENLQTVKQSTLKETNRSYSVSDIKEKLAFEYSFKEASKIPAKMAVSRLYPDILDDESAFDMTAIIKPKVPVFMTDNNGRAAEIGNATHAFMQFCNFSQVEAYGVENELKRLLEKGFLSQEAASLVDINAVSSFFSSDLYQKIKESESLYREKRFNVLLNASDFTAEHADVLKDETVLVQGVIDCFIYDKDGKIILIDYKTDHIPHTMTKEKAQELLIDRHSTQLSYYKKALEKITGDVVKCSYIYSFALHKEIEITEKK